MDTPTRYAVVRDRRSWDATWSGLEPDEHGALLLARVPAPPAPIAEEGAWAATPSGLAAGQHGDAYLADGPAHRIVFVDGACGARAAIPGVPGAGSGPGTFRDPSALALAGDVLYVADRGNDRVQALSVPSLAPRGAFAHPAPAGLAVDGSGMLYVIDGRTGAITRSDELGARDRGFAASPAGALRDARFLASVDRTLYVAVAGSDRVLRFDTAGAPLAALLPDPSWGAFTPGALAADARRLYAANVAAGTIVAFDAATGAPVGIVPGYRGPVAALAIDPRGGLHVKPGAGARAHDFEPDRARVARGVLRAGPFDAGLACDWLRLSADVTTPEATGASLATVVRDHATAPEEADFVAAPSLDRLVSEPLPDGRPSTGAARYLWLTLAVTTSDPAVSPRIDQIEAQTAGRSYMDDLPAVYRRADAESGFLRRWLELFRGRFEDIEAALDAVADRFDPLMAPADRLRALAELFAFDPPARVDPDRLRELLTEAFARHARHGTIAGLVEAIELHTGARVRIVEDFASRHLWSLGCARLGVGTGLAPALPDGMVAGGPTPAEASLSGLAGDYFADIHHRDWLFRRVDRQIDFPWKRPADPTNPGAVVDPLPASIVDARLPSGARFSVRWTGQIMARHSEIYTLHLQAEDPVRLVLAGETLIDRPEPRPIGFDQAWVRLEAGRFYPIVVEMAQIDGDATIKLEWSSRSQRREVVPSSQLYAKVDDHVDLAVRSPHGPPPALAIAGETVVGAHGPLDRDDLGAFLFADTSHRFTVLVPPGAACDAAARDAIRAVVAREKPAHTDVHVCFLEPGLEVGVQATVGVDTWIGTEPPGGALGTAVLGGSTILDSRDEPSTFRIGQRLGRDPTLR